MFGIELAGEREEAQPGTGKTGTNQIEDRKGLER
jgi:hypothetical protein